MNTHRDVYIVLKKSLKWVPIVGWVCKNRSPPLLFLDASDRWVIWHRELIEGVQLNGVNAGFTGHAVLQLYLFGAFVGVRQTVPREPSRLAR